MIDHPDSTGVAVRDQLLFDVFCAAVPEGISLWAHGYRRAVDKYHFGAHIVDLDLRHHRITRTTMVHGMNAAAYTWRTKIPWSTEYPPTLFQSEAGWEFDAADADLVVQLGLFHDLPYSTDNLLRRGVIRRGKILDRLPTG
jgi:hypothetical protein